MDNSDKNLEKEIRLEDLLKLKKLEKPTQVFWNNFDEQLRDKTLERLVYRRSVFSHLSNLLWIACKPAVSLGALAFLTVGVVGYNYRSILYSQSQSMVESGSLSSQASSLMDLASVKKNYIKTSIAMDSLSNSSHSNISVASSSNGVRFSGNIDLPILSKKMATNRIY